MRDDAPYGLDDPQRPPDDSAVRRRVTPPAIFLLIVSVLNLLAGLYFMVNGIILKQGGGGAGDAQVEKQWEDMPADQKDAMKQIGIHSPQDIVVFAANFSLGWGGLTALVGVLTLFGSIRMLSLHSRGLAMFGAILTAIPFVTPCCLIGQIAGIWAIIVLMNPDVRKAFH